MEGAAVAAPDGTALRRFLGVPYAAPPVGALRWRPPEPVTPWTGVRPALAFGPGAPQAVALESPLPGFLADASGVDEDCLFLNVWAPVEAAAPRPVLVWIPGGAFMSGGASQAVYDAARLAAESDAVVVTINYRLGALGFMALGPAGATGDAVTNCGLRDQFAALAWVRANAPAFGGDPDRITVFGESAGAGSILQLLASPRRGDAFRRAVIQSCQPKVATAEQADLVTRAFLDHLGLDRADLDRLRALPVDAILDAQGAAFVATMFATDMMPFHPIDDGDVVDGSPVDAIRAGRAAGVDLVIGTTSDELRLFPDPASAGLERDELVRRIARQLEASPVSQKIAPRSEPGPERPGAEGARSGVLGTAIDAERAVDLYLDALGAGATPGDVWERIRTDTMMRVPTLHVADAQVAHNPNTYVYRFDWRSPGLGAAHATDVPFTFGTFDREGWGTVVGADARAERLGANLRGAGPRSPGPATRATTASDAGPRTTSTSGRRCCSTPTAGSSRDPDAVPLAVWG